MLGVGTLIAVLGLVGIAFTVEVSSLDLTDLISFLPPRAISLMFLGLGMALVLPALSGFHPIRKVLIRIDAMGVSLVAWSYSLYLIYRPILEIWGHLEVGYQIYRSLNAGSITMYALKVTSCLLAGWLFYFAFAMQTVRLGSLLKRRLHSPRQNANDQN